MGVKVLRLPYKYYQRRTLQEWPENRADVIKMRYLGQT